MLRTFIIELSLIFTLEATIFLSKSTLGLDAKQIAEIGKLKLDHNKNIMMNLTKQTADTRIGVILLLLSFLLQLINSLLPLSYADFEISYKGFFIAIIVSIIIYFLATKVSKVLANNISKKCMLYLEKDKSI